MPVSSYKEDTKELSVHFLCIFAYLSGVLLLCTVTDISICQNTELSHVLQLHVLIFYHCGFHPSSSLYLFSKTEPHKSTFTARTSFTIVIISLISHRWSESNCMKGGHSRCKEQTMQMLDFWL